MESPRPPYRSLPGWGESARLLMPSAIRSTREAWSELHRLQSLLNESQFPLDGALLARSASRIEEVARRIHRWARPTRSTLWTLVTSLGISTPLAMLLKPSHVNAVTVATALALMATALVIAAVAEFYVGAWAEVADGYLRIAGEMRKHADRIGRTPQAVGSPVRVALVDEASDPREDSESAPNAKGTRR